MPLASPICSPQPEVLARSRRNALLCTFLVAACMLLARPFAGVPYSDDFSSSKTALEFFRTGHILYNGWLAPIQGWQILWGALFIKLFGFSFNVLRLSILPFAMGSVYLFHQILIGFGVNLRNAAFGALMLGLSPLYMILGVSFMTDVPGLFVLLLCLAMCQRAIVATTGSSAIRWLVAASLLNLVDGTVRQTSWLGALILVPSTAWLLRRVRGVLPTCIAVTIFSLMVVDLTLRWYAHQPYALTEPLWNGPLRANQLKRVAIQLTMAALSLLLLLFPILAGWLIYLRGLVLYSLFRALLWLALICLAVVTLHHAKMLPPWLMPWLHPTLAGFGLAEPDPVLGGVTVLGHGPRLILSVVVVFTAVFALDQTLTVVRAHNRTFAASPVCWKTVLTLVGPFTVIYTVLLFPRAAAVEISDRYLLNLMPIGILLLLLGFQQWVRPCLPFISIAALVVFSIYGVAGTHDFYADLRAGERAVQYLKSTGVPRTAIAESFSSDAWEQVQISGHVNNRYMVNPSPVYTAPLKWPLPKRCTTYLPQEYEPDIHPRYFITVSLTDCLDRTSLPTFPYRAWLPPFHREDYIQQLPTQSPHDSVNPSSGGER